MDCETCKSPLENNFFVWGDHFFCKRECVPQEIDYTDQPKYSLLGYSGWKLQEYLTNREITKPIWDQRMTRCDRCECNLSRYPYPVIQINIRASYTGAIKFDDSVYCERHCLDGHKVKIAQQPGAIFNKIPEWNEFPKIDLTGTPNSGTGYPYCMPSQMKGAVCFGYYGSRPAFCIQYAPIDNLDNKAVMVVVQRFSDSSYLWVKSGGDCTMFSSTTALSMSDLDEIADFVHNGGNAQYKLMV
jgi:hypothetical protein